MTTLGSRIVERRKAMGLTQTALADRAGISKTYLCELERCSKGVGAEILKRLGEVLGMSLDALMTGADGGDGIPAADVNLPRSLSRFAADVNIPFRDAILMYRLQETIMAHREPARRVGLETVDWCKFYEAIKRWV